MTAPAELFGVDIFCGPGCCTNCEDDREITVFKQRDLNSQVMINETVDLPATFNANADEPPSLDIPVSIVAPPPTALDSPRGPPGEPSMKSEALVSDVAGVSATRMKLQDTVKSFLSAALPGIPVDVLREGETARSQGIFKVEAGFVNTSVTVGQDVFPFPLARTLFLPLSEAELSTGPVTAVDAASKPASIHMRHGRQSLYVVFSSASLAEDCVSVMKVLKLNAVPAQATSSF
jgi:hypothetical protein